MKRFVFTAMLAGVACSDSRHGRSDDSPAAPTEPAQSAPQLSKEEILATVPVAAGLHYFAAQTGNHPTLFLDRSAQRLVVVGRRNSLSSKDNVETYPLNRAEAALRRYYQLLKELGYRPRGSAPRGVGATDKMVEVSITELLGSPGNNFSSEQRTVLRKTTPRRGWEVLSGFDHTTNDVPLIGASNSGLRVYAVGKHQSFKWSQSDAAFAYFLEVIAQPPRRTASDR